jgi:hypothetical protein
MNRLDLESNLLQMIYDVEEDAPVKAEREAAFKVYQMDKAFIDIDRSFQYVGDNSRYQQRVTLILSLQYCLFSFTVMCISFFFKKPHFYCSPLGQPFSECSEAEFCRLQELDPSRVFTNPGQHVSIAEHFELYCQKDRFVWLAECGFFAGGFLSGFVQPIVN